MRIRSDGNIAISNSGGNDARFRIGGGTQFSTGANAYINQVALTINTNTTGTVASFDSYQKDR